ncbi:MAG: helix-turn-helix domain-containing protein [Oscillospiraceae bacterium]
MKNFYLITDALDFIETNLTAALTQEQIARHCACSLSALQKLFRYAMYCGIGEYIAKRRITLASRALISTRRSILDIALDYQFNSPEVFTRAFIRVWDCTPSEFRKNRRFPDLFPKFTPELRGDSLMTRRTVDTTALYDILKAKKGTYILCFDTVGLMAINEISHAAGDKTIAECIRRIDDAAAEDMLFFRIGGDEFVLVTGLDDDAQAQALAMDILAGNGAPVLQDGREIPVSMRAAAVRLDFSVLRYSELTAGIQAAINSARDAGTPFILL